MVFPNSSDFVGQYTQEVSSQRETNRTMSNCWWDLILRGLLPGADPKRAFGAGRSRDILAIYWPGGWKGADLLSWVIQVCLGGTHCKRSIGGRSFYLRQAAYRTQTLPFWRRPIDRPMERPIQAQAQCVWTIRKWPWVNTTGTILG